MKALLKYLLCVFTFASLFLLQSCGCSTEKAGGYRIAIDPNWYPLNFAERDVYVLGFTEDLLLEISRLSNMRFEKMVVNWDTLYSGLKGGQYDALLSALPPYQFNQAIYEFSQDFLGIAPVLLTEKAAKYQSFGDLSGKMAGVLSDSPTILLVQKYPDILIRTFNSYPEMLEALEGGAIDAGVMERLSAVGYLNDNFYGRLKIAGSPLSDQAIRLIVLKDKNEKLLRTFDQALSKLKKNKTYDKLLLKWGLSPLP